MKGMEVRKVGRVEGGEEGGREEGRRVEGRRGGAVGIKVGLSRVKG